MKTRLDKIFNIIKWAPIVVFGVGVVLNIIGGNYDTAMLNLCLIVMCTKRHTRENVSCLRRRL